MTTSGRGRGRGEGASLWFSVILTEQTPPISKRRPPIQSDRFGGTGAEEPPLSQPDAAADPWPRREWRVRGASSNAGSGAPRRCLSPSGDARLRPHGVFVRVSPRVHSAGTAFRSARPEPYPEHARCVALNVGAAIRRPPSAGRSRLG